MRVAAGVEYCGRGFCGWQRQSGQRTVQECVESALSRIANHPVGVQCAGRTDTGVHAIQQVIHFDTEVQREPHAWVLGSNSNLPADVRITWAKPVVDEFHARFSAVSRSYRYLIVNRPVRPAIVDGLVSWEYRKLDTARMSAAAEDLLGEHDFTSYRAVSCQAKSPVRQIRKLELSREGDLIRINIEANAFLQHMVRNIAGVLMMIGMGKEQPDWARKVLEARDRTLGGITAQPDGLYLVNIGYDSRFQIPTGFGDPDLVKILAELSNPEIPDAP